MFAPASADNSRYPGFVSFKTLVPIHYPKRWMRTALIRATLAPDLIGLAPCPDDFPFTKPEIQFAFATFDAARLRFVLLTEFTLRQLGLHDHAEHFDTMNRSEVLAHHLRTWLGRSGCVLASISSRPFRLRSCGSFGNRQLTFTFRRFCKKSDRRWRFRDRSSR